MCLSLARRYARFKDVVLACYLYIRTATVRVYTLALFDNLVNRVKSLVRDIMPYIEE